MSECRTVDLKELDVDTDTFDKIYSMGYEDGSADTMEEVRNMMSFHQEGLSGYFIILQDDWNELENKKI